MMRSLAAFVVLAALTASVVALPAFAPKVEASEAVALAKADRLDVRPPANPCLGQVWPSFDTACLRPSHLETIVQARLVETHR
jgi:hypothetical protein